MNAKPNINESMSQLDGADVTQRELKLLIRI